VLARFDVCPILAMDCARDDGTWQDATVRRPAWLSESSELVECLLQVRDVGVWQLRLSRLRIGALEDVARKIVGDSAALDQHTLIDRALRKAIAELPRDDYKAAATILFDLDEPHVSSSTVRRASAAVRVNQSLSRFRDPEVGFERPILEAVAYAIERIAVDLNARQEGRSPLDILGTTNEDIILARSLFHIARTLEVLRKHAQESIASSISGILDRYIAWMNSDHRDQVEAAALVEAFNALSEQYLGDSAYSLLYINKPFSPAPDFSPPACLPALRYPDERSWKFIPGGIDAFTGQKVEPFFMSYFPVTNMEWVDYIAKFGWETETFMDMRQLAVLREEEVSGESSRQ
jgi:hypothetical protein